MENFGYVKVQHSLSYGGLTLGQKFHFQPLLE